MHVLKVYWTTIAAKFEKNLFKMGNDKDTCQVNSVGGATGPQEIADMWKIHFQRLYSSNVNSKFCTLLREKLTCMAPSVDARTCLFSVSDISVYWLTRNAVKHQAPME